MLQNELDENCTRMLRTILNKSWKQHPTNTTAVQPLTSQGGVMVKALDGRIVVNKFELQSRYYVHFWTNTLGKGVNPLILPVMD